MTSFFFPVLLASLGGSLHCAAMCGPYSAAVAGTGPAGRAGPSTVAAYHAGRLVTYLALGAAGGALGGALDLAGNAAGIAGTSAVVAGLVLIVWGVAALVPRQRLVRLERRAPSRLGSVLGRALAWFRRFPPLPRALLLGLSTTLVPCGWLYAFVATAAGTGSMSSATGVMLAFWAGTLPALLGAGLGLAGLFARFGGRVRTVSAVLIAVSGIALLGLRLDIPRALTTRAEPPPATGVRSAECPLHPH